MSIPVPLSSLSLYDCGWRCNFCALLAPKKIISAKGLWLQLGLTSSILSGLVPALSVCPTVFSVVYRRKPMFF